MVTGLAVSREAACRAAYARALAEGAMVVAQGRTAGLCAWRGGMSTAVGACCAVNRIDF